MGTTLDITKTQKGPCKVWFGLAVPAAGTIITLGADGTPDAIQNPAAMLVGLTEAGAVCSVGKTTTENFYDELYEAQSKTVATTSMSIKVAAAQVLDPDNIAQATNGIGTPVTISGRAAAPSFFAYTIGRGALTYTGIAAIAPTLNDPTKFLVFHIYKGYNDAPFDLDMSKSKEARIAFDFKGVGIASRAKTDTLGVIVSGA